LITIKKVKEIVKLFAHLYHQIKTRKKIINWEVASILLLGWQCLNNSNGRVRKSINMLTQTLKKELLID
jgi:hypothetical protein